MRNYWINNDLTLISESEIEGATLVQGEDGLVSERYLYVENGILKKVPEPWQEPDWKFRAKITFRQYIDIGKYYPSLLVKLTEPPVNPRYEYSEFFVVYFNTFGEQEQYVFNELGIVKEDK